LKPGSGGGAGIQPAPLGFIATPQYNGLTYWYDKVWTAVTDNNYLTSGSITTALNGSKLKLRGSSNTTTAFLYKNYTSYLEHFVKYDSITVDTTISATSYGITSGIGGGFPNIGKLDLTNTGTAGKATIILNGTTVATSSGALTFANGDTLYTTFQQMRDTLTWSIQDKTSGSSVSVSYIMANAWATVGANIAHSGAQYLTGVIGGAYTLLSSRVVNLNSLNPPLAVIGDSKAQGLYNGASWDYRVSDRLNTGFAPTANFGNSGVTIDQLMNILPDITTVHPQQALVWVGCNDMRQGRTVQQTITEMRHLLGRLTSSGIKPYIISAPETSGNAAANRQYDSALRQNFPTEYINIYDTLASNTASFINSDGIHVTQAGTLAAYTKIVQSGKLTANVYVPSFATTNYDAATLGQSNTFRNTTKINSRVAGAGIGGLDISDSSEGAAIGQTLSLNPYWNTTGIPAAVMIKVTDNASNASAGLLYAFVNGSEKFRIDKTGNVLQQTGAYTQTNGPTQTFKNNTTSFNHTFASVYGTNDDFLQLIPGSSGYAVVQNGAGLGMVVSSFGTTPVIFAPNNTIAGRFFNGGNFSVGSATDNGAFIQAGASTTTKAHFFLNGGSADVSSPTNGMLWYNSTAHTLNFRDNGQTFNLLNLTSNPFSDATALVKNAADATKLWKQDLSGISSGTTRTWTVPNYNGTYARIDGTQSFSGTQIFTDSLRFTKLPNKSTPAATDSLTLVAPNGDVYKTPATSVDVSAEDGIIYNSATNAFRQGGSYAHDVAISGGGKNKSEGTSGSHLNKFSVYADTIELTQAPIIADQTSFVATADVTVANTTTASSLVPSTGVGSTTVPANTLTVGKVLRIKGYFEISTRSSGLVQPTFGYWGLNGSLLGTVVSMSNSISGIPIWYECYAVVRTTGTSGTMVGYARFYDGTTGTITNATISQTVNTTISNTFGPGITWNAADPSNSITTKYMEITVK